MPVTVETWELKRSVSQMWWNLAFVLISTAMVLPHLSALQLGLWVLVFSVLIAWLQRRAFKQAMLRFSQGEWWFEQVGFTPVRLEWKSGSVKRKDLLIWRYGLWPWQRLIIRHDSLKEGDYQRLLRALY